MLSKTNTLLLSILIMLLFAGCSKTAGVTKYQSLVDSTSLKAAETFPETIKGVEPIDLQPGKKTKFKIELTDPLIKTNDVLSNYKLFRFHNNSKANTRINVKSYCDCGGFTKQILSPVVCILDENGTFVKNSLIAYYKEGQATFSEPYNLEGNKSILLPHDKDYYIIVYANNLEPDKIIGGANIVSSTVTSDDFTFDINMRGSMPVQSHPTGKLSILLEQ